MVARLRLLSGLALLGGGLCGCQTAATVAGTALAGTSAVVAPAVSAVSAGATAASTLMVPDTMDLQERQRLAMADRAGPGRFQNPGFQAQRERMQYRSERVRSSPFRDQKGGMASPELARFREHVHRGTTAPVPDPNQANPALAAGSRGSLKSLLGLNPVTVLARQLGVPDPVALTAALPSFSE